MPPPLALFLTLGFMVYLFRRDFREKPNVTWAVWLPIIWLFLSCSRPTSAWLGMFGLRGGGLRGADATATIMEEGSPLDALVYCGLIVMGAYVLNKRQISVAQIMRENAWLTAFFLYCFVAIIWSDFPLVSFKRWIKILGHPIMVLVLFTEPDPEEALSRLMKRCAYILLPVSILFIKYYPKYGRTYDPFGGEGSNTGIATNKNTLGCACLILGSYFFWHLLQILRENKSRMRRNQLLITGFFLLMVGYLLRKAHSATSTMSLVLAASIMLGLSLRLVNKKLIGAYVAGGVILLIGAQLTFDIFGTIVELSGHGSTIEGRAELWQELLKIKINPILGTGFESFWLGDRLRTLWEQHWWHPTEAHNGYLETYLSLGFVGLGMMIGLLFATFNKCRRALLRDFQWGRFRISVLAAIIVYNWPEAAFKGLSPLWFLFYIIAMEYSGRQAALDEPLKNADGATREAELAYGARM